MLARQCVLGLMLAAVALPRPAASDQPTQGKTSAKQAAEISPPGTANRAKASTGKANKNGAAPKAKASTSGSDSYARFTYDIEAFGRTKAGLTAAKIAYSSAVMLFGAESSEAATAMTGLGYSLTTQGDYAEARRMLERAVAIYRKLYPSGKLVPGHQSLAVSLEVLGILDCAEGDFAHAELLFRESLEMQRKLLGNDNLDTAGSLANLASMYSLTGDRARSKELYRESLAIKQRILGPDHPGVAMTLSNLASVCTYSGDCTQAEDLLRKVLDIQKRRIGVNHPDYGVGLLSLAIAYCETNQILKAEPLLREALEVFRKSVGTAHSDFAYTLFYLGEIELLKGNIRAAEPLMRQSLDSLQKSIGAEHPNFAFMLSRLARLYLIRGDRAKSQALVRQALAILEKHATHTHSILSERRQILLTTSLRYLLDCYLSLGVAGDVSASDLYGHCLRWKGSAFTAWSETGALRKSPELSRQFEDLQTVSARLAALVFKTPEPKQQAAWKAEIDQLVEKKEALEASLAQRNADFRRQKEIERLDPEGLMRFLPERTALVDFLEYFKTAADPQKIGWTFCERHLAAFILRRDQAVVFIDLGPVAPLQSEIETWRATFGAREAASSAAAAIKRSIWEPLAGHLSGIDTVLISPDGDLARFPFAALPGKQPGTYLLEDLNLAVVPVPRLLAMRPTGSGSPTRDGRAVLLGDVDFDASPSASPSDPPRSAAPANNLLAEATHRSAARHGAVYFSPLPGTAAEIEQIAALHVEAFGRGKHTVIRGLEASEDVFRTEAPRCTYLHLATHGFFQPVDDKPEAQRNRVGQIDRLDARDQIVSMHPGLQCGLALAGANGRGRATRGEIRDDGILTGLEVASLDLRNVDLVTLSACETALGKTARGEGVLGLQRAFQFAGARNVVASLWEVDDQWTTALMRLFYDNLWVKKDSPAVALRGAQLAVLRNPDIVKSVAGTRGVNFQTRVKVLETGQPSQGKPTTNPYFWAGFVLSGSPN
jgi:CHAT domain-containing protein/tetratricopeptide (TPR) repeat protein